MVKKLDLEAEIIKEFGEGVLTSGRAIVEDKRKIIPVSPGLDIILGGGIAEGSFCVVTGPPKVGKAQKLDSIIYTIDGPKTMGEIQVGDKLCHPDGGYTTVTDIFPQGLTDAYKVDFSDGSSTVCCGNHLWKVKTRFTDWKILSTDSIKNEGLRLSDRYRWMIPLVDPVRFEYQQLELDPYFMGLLLGDGSFRGKISFTTIDEELLNHIVKHLDQNYKLTKNKITYNIVKKPTFKHKKNKYVEMIKEHGLWQCSSHTKFIPTQYLYNTVDNRWALLQGLMDTDGSADKKGNCEYSTVSQKLANDIKILVQSLGGLCKVAPRTTTCNGKTFKSFRLRIMFNDNRKCFRLTRKVARCHKRKKIKLKRRIINIHKLTHKIPTQCISVAALDGLYVTDDFLVTHNTSMCLDFAGTAQNKKYACDIGRKEGRRVVYASIEGRLKERDLKGIAHLDMDKLLIIKSTPENILTAESFLDILERLINDNPGDIFIIDSFSSLCTAGERDANIGDRYRADAPLLLARFCRRISNVIPVNKTIILGITHRIANQGKGMSQWSEASGQKVQYAVDIKLKATHDTPWLVGEGKIGQDVHWVCDETALNSAPGGKFTSKFRYGYGIDKAAEIINLAVDMSLIKKGGAWYTLPDGQKAQGIDKAADYLKDNPAVYKKLDKTIKDMMGIADAST